MDEQLASYRNAQRQFYLQREKEREDAEMKAKQLVESFLEQVITYSNLVATAENIDDIIGILTQLSDYLRESSSVGVLQHESLPGIGMVILETINTHPNIHINVHNRDMVEASQRLNLLVKEVLTQLGVDTEGMDLELDMDCSRDEQLARELQMNGAGPSQPPPLKRKRGRPRKNQ
jgi:hypothetical protein